MKQECIANGVVYEAHPTEDKLVTCRGCEGFKGKGELCEGTSGVEGLGDCGADKRRHHIIWKAKNEQR